MSRLQDFALHLIDVQTEDEDQARRGRLLNTMVVIVAIPLALALILLILDLRDRPDGTLAWVGVIILLILIGAWVLTFLLAKREWVDGAGTLFLITLALAIAAYTLLYDDTLSSLKTPYWLVITIIGAAMIIRAQAAFWFATGDAVLVSIVAVLLNVRSASEGSFLALASAAGPPIMLYYTLALISWLLTDSLNQSVKRAQRASASLDAQLKQDQRIIDYVQDRLTPMAERLAISMEQMKAASEGIATATNQMAQGAEDQAREIEKVSQAMAELATLTSQMADNLRQASAASTQTQTVLHNTSDVLEALGTKLNDINRVVTLVEKIADQTNLLSLNASIEAARAGEHGAGFAVVADEVRRLADSSANSVGEIADLSHEIGNRLEEVLEAMEKARQESTHAVNLAQEIVEATGRQERAVEAVVGAMNGVASVAEQSAASSEEIAVSVEQQGVSVEQVAASAQTLFELVTRLQWTLEEEENEQAGE